MVAIIITFGSCILYYSFGLYVKLFYARAQYGRSSLIGKNLFGMFPDVYTRFAAVADGNVVLVMSDDGLWWWWWCKRNARASTIV